MSSKTLHSELRSGTKCTRAFWDRVQHLSQLARVPREGDEPPQQEAPKLGRGDKQLCCRLSHPECLQESIRLALNWFYLVSDGFLLCNPLYTNPRKKESKHWIPETCLLWRVQEPSQLLGAQIPLPGVAGGPFSGQRAVIFPDSVKSPAFGFNSALALLQHAVLTRSSSESQPPPQPFQSASPHQLPQARLLRREEGRS